MAHLQVKDVPEELHRELRRRVADEGVSMWAYLLDMIRRDLAVPSRDRWLERLRARESVDIGRPAAEVIAEGRAERDAGRR
jgi:antitoxin FitA